MNTNNSDTIDFTVASLVAYQGSTEFARVNADGTCTINWDVCKEVAKQWKPHGEVYQAIAKLLIYAREHGRG